MNQIAGPPYFLDFSRRMLGHLRKIPLRNMCIDIRYKTIPKTELIKYFGPDVEISYYLYILYQFAKDIFFEKVIFTPEIVSHKSTINFLKQLPDNQFAQLPIVASEHDQISGMTRVIKDEMGKTIFIYYSIPPTPMNTNYFHTAAIKTAKEKGEKDTEVIEYRVRFGTSVDSIKAKMIRELDEDIDTDDIDFLIEPVF